jgi:hypothetical protein
MVRRSARGSRRTLESMVQDSSQRMMAPRARVFPPPSVSGQRTRFHPPPPPDGAHGALRLPRAPMSLRRAQAHHSNTTRFDPLASASVLTLLQVRQRAQIADSRSARVAPRRRRGQSSMSHRHQLHFAKFLEESVGLSSELYTCTASVSCVAPILHAASSHAARLRTGFLLSRTFLFPQTPSDADCRAAARVSTLAPSPRKSCRFARAQGHRLKLLISEASSSEFQASLILI